MITPKRFAVVVAAIAAIGTFGPVSGARAATPPTVDWQAGMNGFQAGWAAGASGAQQGLAAGLAGWQAGADAALAVWKTWVPRAALMPPLG